MAFSQDPNLQLVNPLPVSPQAAAITKYTDIPVSLNSGLANISIPITQIKTGAINFPITLSYNSSGIKIEEIASNVGLGWNLSYTGSITRQVRGIPDDGTNGWFDDSSYVQEYLRGHMGVVQTQQFERDFRTANLDGQPDIYYYNLPGGQSGKFFLDTSNHWVCFPKTNLQIEMSDYMLSWKITTDQGIQYFFTATEFTSTSTSSNTSGIGIDGSDFNGNTAWYITKIIDPAGNEVDFTYTQSEARYMNKAVETYKVNTNSPDGVLNDEWTSTITNNDIVGKKIKSISWREGQVNFYYSNAARKDISSSDTALSRIDIVNNQSKLVNSYRLFTSYFGNVMTPPVPLGDSTFFYRLRLDSVQEAALGLSLPPYKFDYSSIPLAHRLSDDQDYWGYYNGKGNTMFVEYHTGVAAGQGAKGGADRSIDTVYTQGDILQKVHYPTGGAALFEYEPNRFAQFQDSNLVFSSVPLGGIGGDNSNHDDPDQYLYIFNDSFTVSTSSVGENGTAIFLSKMSSQCQVPGNDYCRLQVTLYNPDGSVNKLLDAADTLYLAAGTYRLHGEIETEFGAGSLDMEGYLSSFDEALYPGVVQPAGLYDKLAGGVRVKRITMDDGAKVTGIKEFYYNALGQSHSSGSIGANNNLPQYGRPEADYLGDPTTGNLNYTYNVYSSSSNYALTTSGSAYVTYANVETVEKDSAGIVNGKSDFYYTSFADHPDGNDALTFPFPPPASYDWQRGLLIRQDDFRSNSDGSFGLVRQKMNNYTFVGDSTLRGVVGLMTGLVINYTPVLYNDTVINSGYVWTPFETFGQVFYLQSDTTVLYDMKVPGNKFVNINTYNYKNSPILLKSQTTTASNNDVKKTTIRYAGDFDPYGFISSMQQANDIATPIETITSRVLPSSQELVTAGVISTYRPSQLTRDKVYTVQSNGPVPSGQFASTTMSSGGTLQMDNTYKPLLEFNRYDQFGNIAEEQKTGDLKMTYLWDYNKTSPIAEVKNADSASVAYTSFEADGTGNWTLGSGSVDSTQAFTGRKSYALTGSISRSGLNSSTTYFVSYWTTGGAKSISGTVSGYPQKGKTILLSNSSWTLYVHKVTGQSTITLSGSGNIDELRLYPATAQMTTYTYSPLIGMTSQTDVANRTTYYEYDGLARLKRVRDQDYNILKTLEYQYQTPGGCGGGCSILAMQTLGNTPTLSYPVGVFSVNGKLLGNAATPDDYVTKWNSDTSDTHIGTLSKGADSMHFQLALNSGQSAPAGVTGCRYYQYDLPWNSLDCVIFYNGDYVDWGDGTGMRLGATGADTPAVTPPNTNKLFNPYTQTWTFTHSYPNDSLKTLTFYHSDNFKSSALAEYQTLAGHIYLQNLRGNLPQHTSGIGGSSYQQASALTVANIANWNSINSITAFQLIAGDLVTPCEHVNYAQDFLQNNRGLNTIITTWTTIGSSYMQAGYRDTTFKLSRLKSNWNTYFTNLQDIEISDDHWNREDLSALTKLKTFILIATNVNHSNDPTGNTLLAIPNSVIDSVLIQIANGAGQNVRNGFIQILSAGGSHRTSASDFAVDLLVNKGWYIYVNGNVN